MTFTHRYLRTLDCQNAWHDMIAAGQPGGQGIIVPDDVALKILGRCGTTPPAQPDQPRKETPVPLDQWPLLFRGMRFLARPKDIGMGDVIERVIGPIGGFKFKLWYKDIFGKACRCGQRKQTWNERYPTR